MVSHIASALFRAGCVAILVALPSLLLPSVSPDTAQIVVVFAFLAALLTFMEYYGRYPSIVEFRFAPPYNRLIFIAVAAAVMALAVIMRGKTDPSVLSVLLSQTADVIGRALDFPYSPVRLVILMMPAGAEAGHLSDLRMAAGVSYIGSLALVVLFLTVVRTRNWPVRKGKFNVWVNLPLFDPTRGGDVVERLRRDGGINIVLGALLPFMIPAAVKLSAVMIDPVALAEPQTLIWTVMIWAFLPARMLIRGIALLRVADLIDARRKFVYAREGTRDGLQEA